VRHTQERGRQTNLSVRRNPTHTRIYTHTQRHKRVGERIATHQYIHNPLPFTHTAPDATFRDLLLAIRKDEATHREVNHTFANMNENDDNPFLAGVQYRAKVETVADSTATTVEKKKE